MADEEMDATPAVDASALNDEEETTDTSTNLMASDKSDDTEE